MTPPQYQLLQYSQAKSFTTNNERLCHGSNAMPQSRITMQKAYATCTCAIRHYTGLHQKRVYTLGGTPIRKYSGTSPCGQPTYVVATMLWTLLNRTIGQSDKSLI